MSEDGLHPLESILRLIAAAAPEPWYPRLFAKQAEVDAHALGCCLEDLWLSGLIERADGGPEKGPAITLTRAGQRVLLDPEALQRLHAGEPISSDDRGGIVRQALTGRIRPVVTVTLILLNVLVFVWGYSVARDQRLDNDFLRGTAIVRQPPTQEEIRRQNAVYAIQEKSGSVSAKDVIEGQWWRLLTAGFVHIGFLHLLMNMVFLYLAGRFIEQMWGHIRYLVIYLAGVVGGFCLGVAHNVGGNAGASGAVCGLLGAEAVWFLFNRRYLPRALVRQARTNFFINLVLLVFISSFKDVSGWGHFGGGVAGALTAMLLQLHRFGPPLWRWLALLGFLPLAWYGRYAIEHARAVDPRWREIEREVLRERFAEPVAEALKQAHKVYEKSALPVLEKHPERREAEEVEKARSALAEQREQLQALDAALARFGPLGSRMAEEKRRHYRARIASRLHLLASADEALRDGKKPQPSAEREQQDFESLYLGPTNATVSEAMSVYRKDIRPLFETEPGRRETAALEKARDALIEQGPRLVELHNELEAAGPYDDDTAEKARRAALDYVGACVKLLESCKSGVAAGTNDTKTRKQTLDKREKQVELYRKLWRDKVE
jgi:membrane associated rhomboid family serine protease